MRRRAFTIPAVVAATAVLMLTGTAAAHADTVETVTDEPGAPISIDSASIDRPLVVSASGPVTSVEITLTLEQSSSESCPAPATSSLHYPEETGAVLTSPEGTSVSLILPYDYSTGAYRPGSYVSSYSGLPVTATTTFTSDATDVVGTTNAGIPEDGTFLPAAGSMADFAGEEAAGSWILTVMDVGGLDSTCYIGASLTVTVPDEPTPAPVLASAALPAGTVGTPYTATIGLETGSVSATFFAVADGELPPGLALDPVTGAISGTPTSAGSFSFSVIAGNADEDSAPVEYTIVIDAVLPATGLDSSLTAVLGLGAAVAVLLGVVGIRLRRA